MFDKIYDLLFYNGIYSTDEIEERLNGTDNVFILIDMLKEYCIEVDQ